LLLAIGATSFGASCAGFVRAVVRCWSCDEETTGLLL